MRTRFMSKSSITTPKFRQPDDIAINLWINAIAGLAYNYIISVWFIVMAGSINLIADILQKIVYVKAIRSDILKDKKN
jgi:hypothetical protein